MQNDFTQASCNPKEIPWSGIPKENEYSPAPVGTDRQKCRRHSPQDTGITYRHCNVSEPAQFYRKCQPESPVGSDPMEIQPGYISPVTGARGIHPSE
jgi:hypothetical protein